MVNIFYQSSVGLWNHPTWCAKCRRRKTIQPGDGALARGPIDGAVWDLPGLAYEHKNTTV